MTSGATRCGRTMNRCRMGSRRAGAKLQIPTTKLQGNSKSQAPSSNRVQTRAGLQSSRGFPIKLEPPYVGSYNFMARCRGKFKRRFVGGTKGDSVRGRIFRGYRASGGVEAGAGEALPRTGFGDDR